MLLFKYYYEANIIDAFIISEISFAQDLPKEIDKNTTYIPFGPIEKTPIYPGCDSLRLSVDLKKCMSDKINLLINENFDKNLAKSLGLPNGIVKISNSIKIDTLGNIVVIKITAPHQELEKEAKRVIDLIPKMLKPATQREKPVEVFYTLPIMFKLDN